LVKVAGAGLTVEVKASEAIKFERCWHYSDDVGHNPAHPNLCGRCDSNLHGDGEVRHFA
jgi:isoleucyl-tRNA synthetase